MNVFPIQHLTWCFLLQTDTCIWIFVPNKNKQKKLTHFRVGKQLNKKWNPSSPSIRKPHIMWTNVQCDTNFLYFNVLLLSLSSVRCWLHPGEDLFFYKNMQCRSNKHASSNIQPISILCRKRKHGLDWLIYWAHTFASTAAKAKRIWLQAVNQCFIECWMRSPLFNFLFGRRGGWVSNLCVFEPAESERKTRKICNIHYPHLCRI